ncbi:MAG: preprotein translocase subunit SecG [Candidatus Buchananbacteria bacterium CG10_big_fil_rev_8_21_14_0_10_42_9]|uniref:Protein-export membrane protein SecG n=1 Tax=Candidatus Buchananbacteria bacterium CG10_big_fil_rev_8_21_14_0_10_42_9 TaxID=1974526 RepID=A0A2H0W1C9_9BACT|nr:MAG: preprotein translocase subunit SecG [Candidatus Buchananbacteria bacterium CG10_big_fil_rev_8_21_14_0_10_42_9]
MLLDVLQVVVSIILIIVIILQNRGAGLGAAFGGEGNVYRTKRGLEKILYTLTIVFATAFMVVSFLNIVTV